MNRRYFYGCKIFEFLNDDSQKIIGDLTNGHSFFYAELLRTQILAWQEEIKLLKAKTTAFESAERVEKLYAEAIQAMKSYAGVDKDESEY